MKYSIERHTKEGAERLSPTPMQPPLGYKRAPSLAEQIRQQVLAAKLEELSHLEETDEEADDFNVGEDFEPSSPHENDGMPTIRELKIRAQEINREIERQNTERLYKEVEAKHEEMRLKNGGAAKRPPLPENFTNSSSTENTEK